MCEKQLGDCMNYIKMAKILLLSVMSVTTFVTIAMEKESKQLSKKQQALKLQREARENEIIEKINQDIAEADKTSLSLEYIKKPKYIVVADEDESDVVFEDTIPLQTQAKTQRPLVYTGTPMPPTS